MTELAAARSRPRPELTVGSTWLLHRRQWLELLVAYIGLSAVFVVAGLAVEANDGALARTDDRVARRLVETRTPSLDAWSLAASWAAETVTKIALTALVAGIMLAVWRRWREPLMLAVPLVLEAAVFLTVTLIVARPRPDVPRLDESPVDSSFPSGHVAAASCYGAIVIVAVWRRWPRWVIVLLGAAVAAVTVAVGWARMYRGMHFLTDVIAGVALGLAALVVAWWIVHRAEPGPWRRPT